MNNRKETSVFQMSVRQNFRVQPRIVIDYFISPEQMKWSKKISSLSTVVLTTLTIIVNSSCILRCLLSSTIQKKKKQASGKLRSDSALLIALELLPDATIMRQDLYTRVNKKKWLDARRDDNTILLIICSLETEGRIFNVRDTPLCHLSVVIAM